MTAALSSRTPRERDIEQVNFDGKKRGYRVWAMVSVAITELAYNFILFFCLSRAKSSSRQLAGRPVPFIEEKMDWQLGGGMMMFGACLEEVGYTRREWGSLEA